MPGSVRMRDAEHTDEDEEDYDYEDEDEYEDYDSDSDIPMNGAGEAGPSTSRNNNSWRVLDAAALAEKQKEAVQSVVSILGCKPSVAKTLLIHYRWDKEKIMGVIADRGPEAVFKAAGVAEASETAAPSSSAIVGCQICFSNVQQEQCSMNDCGHIYCNDCWRQHFKTQIGDGQARSIRCMAYKCGVGCDEDLVEQLLQQHEVELKKYQESRLMSYIEDNALCRFCPSVPWCGNAIQVEGDPFCEPECGCGKVFCFKCGREPHSPCTCAMWEAWDEKINGDSETKNWFMANTKPCPKCSKPVEKNGGCNHVTCKCGQSFCWLCGQATGTAHTWQSIQGHTCGRYKDEMDKMIDEAQRNHKRYMHYFERCKMHGDSHKKESVKRADLLKKIQEKVDTGTDCRDYTWLMKALDQLKVARSVLSNSYAFAYFFFGGSMFKDDFTPEQNTINQNLFEDQQQMLEQEVERLSGLVEKCTESLTMDAEERVKVINSTVSIESRIVNFFNMVDNDLYGSLQTCSAQIAMYTPKKNLVG